jgi:hypothetical protein
MTAMPLVTKDWRRTGEEMVEAVAKHQVYAEAEGRLDRHSYTNDSNCRGDFWIWSLYMLAGLGDCDIRHNDSVISNLVQKMIAAEYG